MGRFSGWSGNSRRPRKSKFLSFKGNHSKVGFTSDPRGAKVYVNGAYMGDTPLRLKLESRHDYTIEFVKDGYKTKAFHLTNHIGAGWVVLDVILGLVPVLVDAVTGSWHDLDQKHVNAVLERQRDMFPNI